jgi:hypothetical protein
MTERHPALEGNDPTPAVQSTRRMLLLSIFMYAGLFALLASGIALVKPIQWIGRLIYPGSALIRVEWLRAIKNRAERI